MRRFNIALLAALLFVGFHGTQHVFAVTYAAGWNLVAGPEGSRLTGATGSIFTLQPGDTDYEVFAANSPLRGGWGYWAYFPSGGSVTLGPGVNSFSVASVPEQFIMIGNPSQSVVTISGADTAYTYTPSGGYQAATAIPPGQGAWVAGSQITLATAGPVTAPPSVSPPAAATNQPGPAVAAPAPAPQPAPVPSTTDARYITVVSPLGYQFDVPKDWQRVPPSGSQIGVPDMRWQSPDGLVAAYVIIDAAPSGVSLLGSNTALVVLRGAVQFRQDEYLNFRMTVSPGAIPIPGADSGAIAGVRYTDDVGVAREEDVFVAIRGGQSFTFSRIKSVPIPGSTLLPGDFRLLP